VSVTDFNNFYIAVAVNEFVKCSYLLTYYLKGILLMRSWKRHCFLTTFAR